MPQVQLEFQPTAQGVVRAESITAGGFEVSILAKRATQFQFSFDS